MQSVHIAEPHLRAPAVLDDQLLEVLPVAAYVCDVDGVIVRYNKRAAELWGREPVLGNAGELYCGAHKLYLPNGDTLPHDQTPMVDAMRTGKSFRNLDVQLERPDGTRLWVMVNIDPLHDEQGNIVGAINCFQDVTEHRLEQERKQQIEQLNGSVKRQAEFIATLAHELRNPLTPVRNTLEVMRRSDISPRIESMRALIERQIDYITHLVDDLNDSARIKAGKVQLKLTRVDLRDAVQRGIELTRATIEAASQKFTIDMPEEPVHVQGDLVRLTQVCGNLLANATKFTPLGGSIDVRLTTDSEHAILEVRDNGIGIDPDKLGAIFDMFAQIDDAAARGSGGLGIGLALTKTLMEMHGGSVQAASTGIGQGSVFTCRIPLAAAEA